MDCNFTYLVSSNIIACILTWLRNFGQDYEWATHFIPPWNLKSAVVRKKRVRSPFLHSWVPDRHYVTLIFIFEGFCTILASLFSLHTSVYSLESTMKILKAMFKLCFIVKADALEISFLFDQDWLHNAVPLKSIKHRYVITFPNDISMSSCYGVMMKIYRLNNLHVSYVLCEGTVLVFSLLHRIKTEIICACLDKSGIVPHTLFERTVSCKKTRPVLIHVCKLREKIIFVDRPFYFFSNHLPEVFTKCTVDNFNPRVFNVHDFYNLVHRSVRLKCLWVSEIIAKHQDNVVRTWSCSAVHNMIVNNVNKKFCFRHVVLIWIHRITAIKHFKFSWSRVMTYCFMNENRFDSLIVCHQFWLPYELESFLFVLPLLLQVKWHPWEHEVLDSHLR